MKNKKSANQKKKVLAKAKWMDKFRQMASLMQRRTKYAGRKVRDLEKILRAKDFGEELKLSLDKIYSLEAENKSLQRKLQRNNKIVRNYEILMKNIAEDEKLPEETMKNYFQVAERMGFKVLGSPLQGGLPGLGKKR